MDKRGRIGLLQAHIIDILIIVILAATLILFISGQASGEAIKKQIIAKKLALLLDSAEPGTKITIDFENIIINKDENKISVKLKETEPSYEYEFYNPHNLKFTEDAKENKIIIEVLEK